MSFENKKADFNEKYRYARDYWAPFIRNTQVYTLAASGYTWSDREIKELAKEGREPLEFNIMRRALQFYSGYLRDNINSVVYAPVEGSDQETADQFTELSYYIWDKGNGFPTFLDACDEGFKSGIALCGIQMDYSRDFINGDISFYKRTYNSFYLDPTFTQINLKDCGFALTRDLINRDLAKQLLPFIDPEVIDNVQQSWRDDKFLSYHPNFTNLSRNRNLIAYDQYYLKVTRPRRFLVDMNTSFYRDITDLSDEEIQKLKLGIYRLRKLKEEAESLDINKNEIPNVEIRENVEREFVELNIMLNGEPVYCGDDKTGVNKTYPFVPILGYFEPSIWMPSQRLQGIAATEYYNQRQFNKRHMKIIDMIDSTIATGFKYMIGSVADPSDLQQSGQNRIIGIDPENAPEGMNSVQELQGGNASSSLFEYQKILDDLSLKLANINESILGVDEGGNTQISGRLAQVRIAQGLRGNRKIFDQVETSQSVLGSIILEATQHNYSPGKVKRILGKEPTAQFYEKQFEQYDAVIKEGVRSKSQKDAYYYELVNLKREGIVDVPQAEIVRALQMSGLSDLEKAMQKADEQIALQQKQADELRQKELEVLDASKEEKLGLAQERRSRVISNLSLKDERESEAQQNIAQAALDRSRAIVEIAKLQDSRILEVLQFVNQLERQEAEGREMQKAQVEEQSNRINAETQGTQEQQVAQSATELEQNFPQGSV